jgi:hypothetical protein
MFSKAILNIAPGGNDKEGTAAKKLSRIPPLNQ